MKKILSLTLASLLVSLSMLCTANPPDEPIETVNPKPCTECHVTHAEDIVKAEEQGYISKGWISSKDKFWEIVEYGNGVIAKIRYEYDTKLEAQVIEDAEKVQAPSVNAVIPEIEVEDLILTPTRAAVYIEEVSIDPSKKDGTDQAVVNPR